MIIMDNHGQEWDVENEELTREIQYLMDDEDIGYATAKRRILNNVGDWIPGATRVGKPQAAEPEIGPYPQAMAEGDLHARRSIQAERQDAAGTAPAAYGDYRIISIIGGYLIEGREADGTWAQVARTATRASAERMIEERRNA